MPVVVPQSNNSLPDPSGPLKNSTPLKVVTSVSTHIPNKSMEAPVTEQLSKESPKLAKDSHLPNNAQSGTPKPSINTRSGKTIRPPKKLDL